MNRGLFLDIGNTLVADPFPLASQALAEFIVARASADVCQTDVASALERSNRTVDGLGFSHFWGESAIIRDALFTLGLPHDEPSVRRCLSVYQNAALAAYKTHPELFGLPANDLSGLLAEIRAHGTVIGAISDERKASISRYWDVLGIHDLVDVVITSEEAGVGKPDPRMFNIALERAAVSGAHSVYIGNDYVRDVLGAKAVGMRAVYFIRFNKTPPAQSESAADLTTDDLRQALSMAIG